MGRNWFLKFLIADVTVVSIEPYVERVLHLFHVLQLALPALDEVVDVPDLQVATAHMWKERPVVMLVKVSSVRMCWQVLHQG